MRKKYVSYNYEQLGTLIDHASREMNCERLVSVMNSGSGYTAIYEDVGRYTIATSPAKCGMEKELRADLKGMRAENAVLETENEEIRKANEMLGVNLGLKNADLENLKFEKDELEKQLRKANDELRYELEELRDEVEIKKAYLDFKDAEVRNLRAKNATGETENEVLKKQYEELYSKYRDACALWDSSRSIAVKARQCGGYMHTGPTWTMGKPSNKRTCKCKS